MFKIGFFTLLMLCLGQVFADQPQEVPVNIVSVDVLSNSITLFGLGHPKTEYRMAFDVVIKLLNGENGTASSLEEGDVVTAVIDKSEGVAHALYVQFKP